MTTFILLILLTLTSCQPSLDDQPRFNVYAIEERLPITGTRQYNPDFGNEQRPQENLALIKRGQKYFEIFCIVCHGRLGDGVSIISQHGFSPPPTFHSNLVREMSDEGIYNIITEGQGRMNRLGDRIMPDDRWAIVSYVRVLQLSQNTPIKKLTPAERKEIRK